MTLKDFEIDFDTVILKRGLNYYKNGAILSIEHSEKVDGEYIAEVEGSEIYNVYVDMDKSGEITHVDCDCPYDFEFCKHIAAVLYCLRDMDESEKMPTRSKETLASLLSKCSKEQLEEIILEHSEEDRVFKNHLKMALSESDDINKCISEFRSIAEQAFSGRCNSYKFFKAAEILISKISKNKNSVEIINACITIIKIFYNEYDESYMDSEDLWEFNDVLYVGYEKIEATVQTAIEYGDKNVIAEIWAAIMNFWKGDDDYIGEDRLFPALLQFSAIPEYREKLNKRLIEMSSNASEYEAKRIDRKLFAIIQSYGTKKEREKFINDHISDSDFRTMAIDIAISKKDYEKAEQLALDGERTDSGFRGFASSWKKKRYDIYKLNGNNKKLEEVCRQLILSGEEEYYKEWKSLLPKDKISEKIEELLNTKSNISYEYIVVQENMSDRIYALCCKYPREITEYYGKLKGTDFEEKAAALYEKYLRSFINQTTSRSNYQYFCRMLKGYAKDCGKEKAKKLADNLRSEYYRRPAFIDELNKAGF